MSTRSFMHVTYRSLLQASVPLALLLLLLSALLVSLTALAAEPVALAASLAGAVYAEASTDVITADPPYLNRAFPSDEWRSIARAAAAAAVDGVGSDGNGGSILEEGDGLLTEPATSFICHAPREGRFIDWWHPGSSVETHGVVSTLATQYFFSANASRAKISNPAQAWPYFFLSRDVVEEASSAVHTRVYHGVVELDVESLELLKGSRAGSTAGPESREALVLVYNDWDATASVSLALLEAFATLHTTSGGHPDGKVSSHGDNGGAGIYRRNPRFADLPPPVGEMLRKRGLSEGDYLVAEPDGFLRLLAYAYPPTGTEGGTIDESEAAAEAVAAAAAAEQRARRVLWLRGGYLRPRSPPRLQQDSLPAVRGVEQVIGAMRVAAQATDHESTAMTAVVPGTQFVFSSSRGMAHAPRLTSSSAALTVADLRRFVLRHSLSSVFITSYTQAAGLVADYGRVALLTLPPAYVEGLYKAAAEEGAVNTDGTTKPNWDERHSPPASRPHHVPLLRHLAQRAVVAGLRQHLPSFVLVPPSDSSSPSWWPAATSTQALDLSSMLSPHEYGDTTADHVRQRAEASGEAAILSIVETPVPQRRSGVATAHLWRRHDIRVPLPALKEPPTVWSAHEMVVGSYLVDTVAACERQRMVREGDGSSFQPSLVALQEGLKRDVIVVVDGTPAAAASTGEEGGDNDFTCADRIRLRALHHAEGPTAARYMTISGKETELVSELLHAADELPAAVTSEAARHCSAGIVGVDLAGCTVLCVPQGQRSLFRMPTASSEVKGAKKQGDGSVSDAATHPWPLPNARDTLIALTELQESGADASGWRHAVSGMVAAQSPSHSYSVPPPWRLLFPAHLAAPVVELGLAGTPAGRSKGLASFALLTDATCALSATPSKVFRVLRHCFRVLPSEATAPLGEVSFHEVDVRALSYSSAAERASLVARLAPTMPLLSLGLLDLSGGTAGAHLQPPQFIVQRGSRLLATLPTNAYYQRAPWPRAVVTLLGELFAQEESAQAALEEVLSCVDATTAAEASRRAPMRKGVAATVPA